MAGVFIYGCGLYPWAGDSIHYWGLHLCLGASSMAGGFTYGWGFIYSWRLHLWLAASSMAGSFIYGCGLYPWTVGFIHGWGLYLWAGDFIHDWGRHLWLGLPPQVGGLIHGWFARRSLSEPLLIHR